MAPSAPPFRFVSSRTMRHIVLPFELAGLRCFLIAASGQVSVSSPFPGIGAELIEIVEFF